MTERDLFNAAARTTVENMRLWRRGGLEQLTDAQLREIELELGATADAIGELLARRRTKLDEAPH